MNIQEVSEILGVCWPLRAPKFILITDERIHDQRGQTYFRGLQPKNRGDIIVLGADADATTVPHEVWHAQTGLGELSAWPIGNQLARRYNHMKRFPRVREALTRRVKYREVSSADEFPDLGKYAGRVRLFVLT